MTVADSRVLRAPSWVENGETAKTIADPSGLNCGAPSTKESSRGASIKTEGNGRPVNANLGADNGRNDEDHRGITEGNQEC